MGSKDHQFHMFFLPFMAPGHMLPTVDMARLFAARGVKVTIITSPLNALPFQNVIDRDVESGHQIKLHILRFPSVEAGLPEDCENFDSLTSPEMVKNFLTATYMLQQPFEQLLREHLPNCIISDMYFPWTSDVAANLGIPRLIFHGTSFFSLCVSDSMQRYVPYENVSSDTESFVVPGLPDCIELTKMQMPNFVKTQDGMSDFFERVKEAELRSYGVVVNSFYELERAYVEHYRKEMGRKAWHIGPVSFCNRDISDKAKRGNKSSIEEHNCLGWLDSKKPNSVLYVCFGSMSRFATAQLIEVASALEASGHSFVWVAGKVNKKSELWSLEEFEERMKGKGLIIKGWAPQVLILDHPAIGGFVTHCGWNSVMEGVSAGVPMITWPLFAEQFYNEKLVIQVLKIGVSVGADVWVEFTKEERPLVRRDQVETAVTRVMDGGDNAKEMRKQTGELAEMVNKAVEEGGSSYDDMSAFIEELQLCSVQ